MSLRTTEVSTVGVLAVAAAMVLFNAVDGVAFWGDVALELVVALGAGATYMWLRHRRSARTGRRKLR